MWSTLGACQSLSTGVTNENLNTGQKGRNFALKQGYQIWAQRGSDWSQIGQIQDFFRSDFSTFWLTETDCTDK